MNDMIVNNTTEITIITRNVKYLCISRFLFLALYFQVIVVIYYPKVIL